MFWSAQRTLRIRGHAGYTCPKLVKLIRMFTGIVQARGRVVSATANPFGRRLVVDVQGWKPPHSPARGDSICVSGVCLTVVETTGTTLSFDVVAETLSRTTAGRWQPGTVVNLEPALTLSTPLGGHFMQGHVDGIGQITEVYRGADECRMTVAPLSRPEPPGGGPGRGGEAFPDLTELIVPKGSIAIDGVSLTVASVGRSDFQVALIPVTLDVTTLGSDQPGDRVNLETDIVSRTVVHWLRRQRLGESNVSLDTLRAAGFLEG